MTPLNLLLRIGLFFLFFFPFVLLLMPHLPGAFLLFLPVLAVVATVIADRIAPPKAVSYANRKKFEVA